MITNTSKPQTRNFIYYQEATNYWMKACLRIPYYKKDGNIEIPDHGRILYFVNEILQKVCFAIINSSLFYVYYITFSDGFHLGDGLIKKYSFDSLLRNNQELISLATQLEKDLKKNSIISTRNTKENKIELETFCVSQSKSIIDKIDKVLAKHYGFTDEELDFIINYDIKYRMGDELTQDEE